MNLTTRCPHCGNPRQRHHHESPWCDECFRSLFERLDRLEAIAAAQDTPSSPANAPEVPQGQTGDSDGTERIRVTKWNSHPDAPRWREHSILLNSISWRISEALGQVGPGDTEHQVDLESNITKVLTAIRVWRKVQACERRVETDDAGAISEHIRIKGYDGETSMYVTRHACTFLAWLKDGEA